MHVDIAGRVENLSLPITQPYIPVFECIVMGPDYPSETFRVLQEGEIRSFGEYRTRRLVLEAWDSQERGD